MMVNDNVWVTKVVVQIYQKYQSIELKYIYR